MPNCKSMKGRLSLLFLFLLSTLQLCAQVDTTFSNAKLKADYLKKSRNQKTAAWIILGGGGVFILSGLLVNTNDTQSYTPAPTVTVTGTSLIAVGVLAEIASIPLFMAASKNKKRAMSLGIKNQFIPTSHSGTFVYTTVPSMSITVRL